MHGRARRETSETTVGLNTEGFQQTTVGHTSIDHTSSTGAFSEGTTYIETLQYNAATQ